MLEPIVYILIIIKIVFFLILEKINFSYLKANSSSIPEKVEGIMSEETFFKSVDYTKEKIKFNSFNSLCDSIILFLIFYFGLLGIVYNSLINYMPFNNNWTDAIVLFISLFIFGLPSLPFSWWNTFKLEEKFGFNKSNLKLWISDQVKGFFISLIIGVPLIVSLIWCLDQLGGFWWMWAFAIFFIFQIIMLIIYPMFILPFFNKLEPLESGDLKNALLSLGDRCGFKSKAILVIDGSKRSSHSNAFFTGFGKFRRIVLYDTLINQMEIKELEAVLAHEIGHYKCGHIPKRLFFSAITTFIMFAFLAWLINSSWIFELFGFVGGLENYFIPSFLVLSLFSGIITFWFSPLESLWSRKHEYEADAFAKEAMGSGEYLKKALRKLYNENLSNLIPHPFYSNFYYSHPTLLERENALYSNNV